MRRPLGHQPEYASKEDHGAGYSRDTPKKVDVILQQIVAIGRLYPKETTLCGGMVRQAPQLVDFGCVGFGTP
jgi:hypothetical protein